MRKKSTGCVSWRPAVMDQLTGFSMRRLVVRSWDGERVEAIAKGLDCSPQTVRRRLHRFETEGIEGLGDRPKAGRPRRLTAEDDSRIIALVRQAPPGQLERRADEMVARDKEGSAQWSLDALTQAAGELGIAVKRERDPPHLLARRSPLAADPQLGDK